MIAFVSPPPAAPVIGISGGSATSKSVQAMALQIRTAGGIPLYIGNHANRSAGEDIGKIDALVVLGNDADIDPTKYGQQTAAATHSEMATDEGRARAAYEEELLALALVQKMPVLTVCAGMQRLNVMLGGSLHQNLKELTGYDHDQRNMHIAPSVPVEPILIDPDSKLGSIAEEIRTVFAPAHGTDKLQHIVMENSMHHQAVNKVGDGLRAVAFAEDKLTDGSRLVEAYEACPEGKYKDQFLIGVQWHPEFGASPMGHKIAVNVTGAAQAFAQAHNRTHPETEAQEESIKSALPVFEDLINAANAEEQAKRRQAQTPSPTLWANRITQERVAPSSANLRLV